MYSELVATEMIHLWLKISKSFGSRLPAIAVYRHHEYQLFFIQPTGTNINAAKSIRLKWGFCYKWMLVKSIRILEFIRLSLYLFFIYRFEQNSQHLPTAIKSNELKTQKQELQTREKKKTNKQPSTVVKFNYDFVNDTFIAYTIKKKLCEKANFSIHGVYL